MTSVPLALGLDVGGTKVVGGVVDPAGEVLATVRRPTPADDVAATRDVVVDVARELAARHPVAAVGIGTTGLVDATRSTVLFATNLGWRDEPLREHVTAAVGLPVVVENDANAAAWAEFRYGAARDATESMVMFTVGTGIGGGFVLGGELVRGATGIAAEPGHMVAVPDGRPCGCGRAGCLDQYASGRALVRYAEEGATARPGVPVGAYQGGGAAVTEAARAGDPVAVRAFRQVAGWIARGMADVAQLLDPQVLVVGGGVAEAGDLLMTPLLDAYRKELGGRGAWSRAQPQPAELGNLAGLVGAADLARRHLTGACG
ncbi:ROK family glucokinase [Micromonospora sp. NPDC092111]|uniref:ROK family glucokinase n=1 Tax=Micromonospora sp. NPDC092111 TaxID=3364289 RepID=UPI0037F34AE7